MSLVTTTLSQNAIAVLAALPMFGIVATLLVLRRRRRRRAESLRRDEEDFELVFPEGPDDHPVRRTAMGRRIARR
jgi:hypothetical protein